MTNKAIVEEKRTIAFGRVVSTNIKTANTSRPSTASGLEKKASKQKQKRQEKTRQQPLETAQKDMPVEDICDDQMRPLDLPTSEQCSTQVQFNKQSLGIERDGLPISAIPETSNFSPTPEQPYDQTDEEKEEEYQQYRRQSCPEEHEAPEAVPVDDFQPMDQLHKRSEAEAEADYPELYQQCVNDEQYQQRETSNFGTTKIIASSKYRHVRKSSMGGCVPVENEQ